MPYVPGLTGYNPGWVAAVGLPRLVRSGEETAYTRRAASKLSLRKLSRHNGPRMMQSSRLRYTEATECLG